MNVLIIGGGASGMAAALTAARPASRIGRRRTWTEALFRCT